MARHVTITGPRLVSAEVETQLPVLFDQYLGPFAGSDATFFLGGAAGLDTFALEWLAEYTQVTLIVAVPCAVDDQPAVAAEVIRRWQGRGRIADLVELHAEELDARAYHARNRWMVDRSDLVIGFPHGTEQTSGTWYTVNYAASQGKPRLVVPI